MSNNDSATSNLAVDSRENETRSSRSGSFKVRLVPVAIGLHQIDPIFAWFALIQSCSCGIVIHSVLLSEQ